MVTTRWREDAPLARLFSEPQVFNFFQAIRLLEQARQEILPNGIESGGSIGSADLPQQEFVRLRTLPNNSFPLGQIETIQLPTDDLGNKIGVPQLWVTFMGLIGVAGALPQHYTEMVNQCSRQGNQAPRDFFDIFNHRILSLFYKTWEKYHFNSAYERNYSLPREDLFTFILSSLAGIGSPALRRCLTINNSAIHYYAGLFAQRARSASALQELLSSYFNLPCHILQLQGRWLALNKADYSYIGTKLIGRYHQLGRNFILGQRCWNIQSKFRIYIGPLNYEQFQCLLPTGNLLKSLTEITRFYAGSEFNFDVQVELQAAAVPIYQLQSKKHFYLGWNTWLTSRPLQQNANQVIFYPKEDI